MRSVKMNQIEENIKGRRKKVNSQIRSEQQDNPRVKRSRTRSMDERIALTEITRASVERARREGKIKMIGKRRMYYDPAE